MRLCLQLLAFVRCAHTAASTSVAARAVSISVVDHGADPTGKADATAAFRAALAAAQEGVGPAVPVVVPSGSYMISGTLNVTMQTLMGPAPSAWVSDGSPQPLITFRPFGENPQHGAAFVAVGAGGSVHGLHVQYDWQDNAIRAIPPCVDLRVGDGPRVTDMRISSAWDAVSSLGNSNCGRYYVANLFIVDAHHYGLAMGASFDFSTIDQVEVWNPNSLFAFHNGTGVLINVRCDQLHAASLSLSPCLSPCLS